MSADAQVRALQMEQRRRAQVPADAVCRDCATTQHLKRDPQGAYRCYACQRRAQGLPPSEKHHLAGRKNWGGLTLELRDNDHRTVTELEELLGIAEWPPANGDPLLILARFLVGLAIVLWLLAEWLRAIAQYLRERLGDGWFRSIGSGPVVG